MTHCLAKEEMISRAVSGWHTLPFIMEITSKVILNLRKAIDTYDDLMKREGYNEDLHVYKSCCLFALCKYDEAKEECEKGKDSDLKVK